MNFWQNRIPTGKPSVTLKDLVDKVISQREVRETQVKTASTEEAVKTAETDEAPSSGQLDVEPLHQTGDSVKPSATTKNETAAAPSPKKDEDCEADSSGQPEAEGKLVNKPEVKEEETKEETKEDKKDKEIAVAKTDEKVKEAAIEDIQKAKEEDEMTEEELAAKKEEEKETATEETEKKTAVTKTEVKKAGFVRLANLDDKTKSWLRTYWRNLYPEEYVEAMLAEK